MNDGQPKAPTKNWTLQILLCAGVAVWQGYQLAAPGEAQPSALIVLEWIILGCAALGFVVGLAMQISRR